MARWGSGRIAKNSSTWWRSTSAQPTESIHRSGDGDSANFAVRSSWKFANHKEHLAYKNGHMADARLGHDYSIAGAGRLFTIWFAPDLLTTLAGSFCYQSCAVRFVPLKRCAGSSWYEHPTQVGRAPMLRSLKPPVLGPPSYHSSSAPSLSGIIS